MTLLGFTALSVEIEHEVTHPMLQCRVHEHARAAHVVEHGLTRRILEQRHVLVRGGVQHDRGRLAREHRLDGGGIAQVGEHRGDRERR
jgi:hypothetical protein